MRLPALLLLLPAASALVVGRSLVWPPTRHVSFAYRSHHAAFHMMAKKRRKKQEKPRDSRPAPSTPPAIAGPPSPSTADATPLFSVTVPEGLAPGDTFAIEDANGRTFELTVPQGSGSGQQLAVELPSAKEPSAPVPAAEIPFPLLVPGMPAPSASAAPSPSPPRGPSRYAQGMDLPAVDEDVPVPKVDLELLSQVVEAPANPLPSFDDYLKKRKPEGTSAGNVSSYNSKLPSINPGKPGFVAPDDGKSPFERIVTRVTWTGIGLLFAIEIFINTPLFQQIKPAVLNFLGDK
ncbi:hypothetical protein AB1Y20_022461 [Prymnesium parvum]|uniref:Uncharacterized protein n=1 Tax=Prymnesium parvum TaxID=97485 RepID=A0AB34JJ19_PRYPA